MENELKVKYLIIGNSAGGIGAAEAIREIDRTGSIAIVSDEPYPAYSRPLISEYLGTGRPLEKMLFRPADFYEKNNIQALLGKKAVRLDTDEHSVETEDGSLIYWEKLLLATGGLPIIPPIAGTKTKGVFTFLTLDDARAIERYLSRTVRAVVIGGGLIGVSVTEALVKRKVKVTIVEMKERILNTILDEEASAVEKNILEQAGVNIITGRTVAEIVSYTRDNVTSVVLDDGQPMSCNMVIIAIGVRPNIELVSGTEIKVNRGIAVERSMQTSIPDIYACGDAAECYDFIYGENRLTPVWPNAYMGGRTAGFNMAGVPVEYTGGTSMNALKYFGVDILSAGIVTPPDSSYEVIAAKQNGAYKKVVIKDGLVVGMVYMGDIERGGIVYGLMREKVNVDAFKHKLVAADFGLSSLPEEIWRPVLEMPVSEPATASCERVEQVVV